MTANLSTWLRAQLDTDAAEIAKHPDGEDHGYEHGLNATEETGYPSTPYLAIRKKRALDEVDAKRRILAEHHPVDPCDAHDASGRSIPCDTLLLLALPYATRPGYRSEWAP